MCCFGAGGANSPDGSGPGSSIPGTNATFVYQAGGVGYPGSPGSATWIADTGLGRYWIHEFATRIVPNPDESDVYLITPGGTYRHFVDTNMDDLYDQVSPSDEFRTLEFNQPTTGEWRLTGLDGAVTVFNADGSFESRSNRLGHTWAASYSGGMLDSVTFPDGRQETFLYDGGGRLEEIQQIGLESDGSTADCSTLTECRSWVFTWNGNDLARIDYPDMTARVFTYSEPLYPGYMTLRELEGANGVDRRVEGAWEYTASGRIHKTWRGASSFEDPEAADKYEYTSYDDESMPTSVEITDPFGNPVTYTIGYDDASSKPRLQGVIGECPSCGGPNQTLEYMTLGNELLPSARIDGEGNRTEYLYDSNGRVTDRFEAVGSGDSRTISYQYDGNYPGLVSMEERPSTSGSGFRTTSWIYHSTLGYLESMTMEGDEVGYDDGSGGSPEDAFVLTTNYLDHNVAGQPEEVDPPGFDGVGDPSDSTLFTYDVLGRNGLLADSRTDPVLGVATTYEYDGLNRRTRIIDPNSIATESTYDPMDRVEEVTQAQGLPQALTTDYQYTTYGDLERVVYPLGNVVAYEYG
jgi:YD repeat-containing protein